jgi:superfamily II DNA or RNA helicase
MSKYFRACGIPAAAVSAETADTERKALRNQLIEREIKFLFVVNLFNEGVDLPEVDTILFLRPTESLTVFL